MQLCRIQTGNLLIKTIRVYIVMASPAKACQRKEVHLGTSSRIYAVGPVTVFGGWNYLFFSLCGKGCMISVSISCWILHHTACGESFMFRACTE